MSGVVLKDYQEETVQYGLKNNYCIYALSMGLGKGPVSLETFRRLGPDQRLLVICPGYLILNWKSEINKFYGGKYTVTSFKSGKDLYFPFDSDIVLISYDMVQKAEYLFEWATMVILEEGHYLKGTGTKRSQFIHKAIFENSVPRVLILTGTPIKNRVEEFYSLLAICNYNPAKTDSAFLDKFPSQAHFADHFSYRQEFEMRIRGRRIKVVKWEGIRNIDELKTYLKDVYIRFGPEVLDLPPVIFEDVLISDTDDPGLMAEYLKWQETSSVAPNFKASAALEKVQVTVKIAKDSHDQGLGPIIIFTDHRASASALAEKLSCPYIDGQVSNETRWRLAQEFQAGKLDYLVATVGSFSTGVTLTAASRMIFNDYPWVPGDLDQAIYRINRIGQDKQCTVIRVLGSPQDTSILKAVESKRKVIEKVI